MIESIAAPPRQQSLTRIWGRSSWRDRRVWLAFTAVALIAGAALNWKWLVAAGILPVLFTALPCVAMCALHLCSWKDGNRGCKADDSKPTVRDVATER